MKLSGCLIASLLISSGQTATSQDMREAILSGNIATVIVLLDDDASLINTGDDRGLTPLHTASEAGEGDIVRLLIEKGALVDAPDSAGFTPLHRAALVGHQEVVEILVEAGADPDLRNPGMALVQSISLFNETCSVTISMSPDSCLTRALSSIRT